MLKPLHLNKDFEELNFFTLSLVGGERREWKTTLSFSGAKGTIASTDYIDVGNKEDINTKMVISIRDRTDENREFLRSKNQEIQEKFDILKECLDLVQQIRSFKKIPFLLRWRYPFNTTPSEVAFERGIWELGSKIDPLMGCTKKELESILAKLKKNAN